MTVIFTGVVKKAGGFRVAKVAGAPVAPAFTIGQSLLFNGSSKLSRTPSGQTNRKTWTLSTWLKRGLVDDSSNANVFLSVGNTGSDTDYLVVEMVGSTGTFNVTGGLTVFRRTVARFRDPAAWYHFVVAVDTTQGIAADRIKVYVNGVEITDFDFNNNPGESADMGVNRAFEHKIGVSNSTGGPEGTKFMDGYLSEYNFVDGQALDPTSFGEFDSNGDWNPIDVSGLTFGTNGFHLDYAVAPGTGDGAGTDVSGNENHFTDNNLFVSNQKLDTPIVNYATMNPFQEFDINATNSGGLLSGNLQYSAGNRQVLGTFAISDGKWYWEIDIGPIAARTICGIGTQDTVQGPNRTADGPDDLYGVDQAGRKYENAGGAVESVSFGTFTIADVLSIAVNKVGSSVKVWMAKNDDFTFYSAGADPANDTNPLFTISNDQDFFPVLHFTNAATKTVAVNFGNSPVGDGFIGTVPTGFLKLSSANLPTPAITNPGLHFNTILHTGDAAETKSFTGVGFQPDLVWFKSRSAVRNHSLIDAVRGGTQMIQSSSSAAEQTSPSSGFITSFDIDGFSTTEGSSNHGNFNANLETYVGWTWKEGATAGFSIISYTGDDNASRTISHGLGSIPAFGIIKNLGTTNSWGVKHQNLSSGKMLRLEGLNTEGDIADGEIANFSSDTTFGFTTGTSGTPLKAVNELNDTYIAYIWAEVEGYSKFGIYDGNNSTNGPFVYCGFRPAYLLIKRSVGGNENWVVRDAVRELENPENISLKLNLNSIEGGDSSVDIDFLANGFKVRGTNTNINGNSSTYIFAAFAESPFKTARAR